MIGSRAVTGLRSIRRIKMASQSPVVRKAAATTSGPASAKRDVVHDGVAYATVQEGLAYILVPKAPTPTPKTLPARPNDSLPTSPQSVFYNPIQQFNRDLSVLAIRAFGEDYVRRSDQKSDSFKKRAKCRKDSRDAKRRCVDGAVGQPGDLQGGEGGETEQYDTAGEGASLHVAGDTVEGGNDLSHGKSGGNAGIANYASNAETAEAAEKTGFNEGQLDHLRRQLVDDIEDVSFEQELYEAAELAMANGGSKAVQGPSTEEGSIKAPAAEAPGIDVASAPAAEAPGTDGAHTSKDPPASSKPRCRFTILDALSATGLRALRYSSELPFVTSVTANDLSAKATDNIKLNVQHNGLEEKIQITTQNACAHMYSLTSHAEQPGPRQARYQVIDLDPYGTAVPMFDAALQALDNGGMLCVTCTDSSVFASSGYIEKTFSLYGGLPLKGLHSHEAGLRLVLHALCMTAARHGLVVEPLLSLSIDYYVRVFVKVRRAAAEVKFLASKTMVVYACDGGCGAWTTQYLARSSTFAGVKGELCKHTPALAPTASSRCEHCGFKTHLAGPMYGGPLHHPGFVQTILGYLPTLDRNVYGTAARIEGMLRTAYEELSPHIHSHEQAESARAAEQTELAAASSEAALLARTDPALIDRHPFYFFPSALSALLHVQSPPEAAFKGALRHAGYWVSRSHAQPGSIKTDAPWSFLWHLMREWVRQRCTPKEGSLKKTMPGWLLMHPRQNDSGPATDNNAGADAAKTDAKTDANGSEGQSVKSGRQSDKQFPPVVFNEALGRDRPSKKLVRYQMNPRRNWGPMAKAA